MHLAYLNVHDLQVAWMQDQLSFIANEYDEEGVLELCCTLTRTSGATATPPGTR